MHELDGTNLDVATSTAAGAPRDPRHRLRRRIRMLNWEGLRDLWDQSASGRTPAWPPGKAFEYLILRAFELDGATVRWPFDVTLHDSVIEQIDGAVYAAPLMPVEAKDSTSAVDVAVLAKLRTQLARRPSGTIARYSAGRASPGQRLPSRVLRPADRAPLDRQ